MNILFLSAANDIHTVRWVNELTRKGHNVNLVFCKNHAPNTHQINSKVNLISLPFSSGVGYYLNAIFLKKIVKSLKCDIINVHFASGYGTLARISRVKPVVLSVWGADVYDFPYWSKFNMYVIKKNLNYASQIASTSYAMSNQVHNLIKPKQDIKITPFGVDTNKYSFREKKIDFKNIKIGIVKKIDEKYGINYLIDAFSILNKKLNDMEFFEIANGLELLIYGDGNQKEEMINLTKRLGISEKVKFMGRIPNDEVPNVMKTLDIFALSSILDSESFGVSAVEAMSTGLPVVATDVDGFKEVIDNEKNGIIVPRKDSESMSEALLKIILDEELGNRLGKNARKKVEKEYTFSDNVDYMLRIYTEVKKEVNKCL